MQAKPLTRNTLHNLQFLPKFAQYLLDQKIDELLSVYLEVFKNTGAQPAERIAALSAPEQKEGIRKSLIALLTAVSNNELGKGLDHLASLSLDEHPLHNNMHNGLGDAGLTTFIRKQSLLHFIPAYADGMNDALSLIREIDLVLLETERVASSYQTNRLKDRIDEHIHFIEKITNTSPGIIYVYDVQNNRELYANSTTKDFLGYSPEEIKSMGDQFVGRLIHPDDQPGLRNYEKEFQQCRDGEVRTFRYRIKNSRNEFRWMRTFETVFKRDASGAVLEKIGIAIDVHDQKQISDALREREAELLEAQEIAQLGSFFWSLGDTPSAGSPQTQKILGIDLQDQEGFFRRVHPDDLPRVRATIDKSIETGKYECEFRYRSDDGKEKVLWVRGIVNYDERKQPTSMHGTLMDITEKENLVERLMKSEKMYRQAEELSNMGNWTWDISTDTIEWTDQLYKIYGLPPQSERITVDRFLQFVHPDDRAGVNAGIEELYTKNKVDYTFRIISADGQTKIIRSLAHAELDQSGRPVAVIGTERDVTDKQRLIERLQDSEQLYKQAQALARIGNFAWDLQSNDVTWSDEAYHIYGVEPGTPVSFSTAFEPILPEYQQEVQKAIEESIVGKQGRSVQYAIKVGDTVRHINLETDVVLNSENAVEKIVGTVQDLTERQLLIDRLKQSEKLYKQAQSMVHMGNWSMDLRTKEFSWSDEMYRIYELEPGAEISFDAWTTYIHPDEKEDVLGYLQYCIDSGEIYERIHRILLPSGNIKMLHRKGDFTRDENGNVIAMNGTTQDVTEQQRIQQELKDNQTFIRKIADATPAVITTYNIHSGKYLFISEGLEVLLGYNPSLAQEEGISFFMSIIHPDDLPELMDRNARVLQEANEDPDSDPIITFTYRMRNKDGDYRWVHTYGTVFDRNSAGQVEHVLNISLDITDQREANEKIAEQEHFIQQIADASPTILYLYDVDTQSMVYVNREIYFVLGYLPDEVIEIGPEVTELLYNPEDHQLLPSRTQSTKTFQQVESMMQYECRMKHKDGTYRWFLVREIVFKTDEKGAIKQILGAALDINRRKDMERTILQNTLQLEQSNASLEEFAYVASHDLKEPLRKISTFGDRLIAGHMENLNPEGRIYLKKIVDASQRMQTMISDLLSISMISGNREFENFSLQKIFEETVQTLEFKIEQVNAIVTADPLPEVSMVPSQFRQLFQNLLSNSLKFIREGVQPRITIKCSSPTDEEIGQYTLARSAAYIKLEFSDNGIGFENEFAGKIFAIFQRLHGRSEYEGSGIGLAICKKIVEHHGGCIYATSVPGEGAQFTIILPSS